MIATACPYLIVDDGARAIEFYSAAFGARETLRLQDDAGAIAHAELEFGGSTVMLANEFPEYGIRSAGSIGGTPVSIRLQVDDADAVVSRAVEHGATIEHPVEDKFYGERSGSLFDPFGHRWLVGHPIETVAHDEMQRRLQTTSEY